MCTSQVGSEFQPRPRQRSPARDCAARGASPWSLSTGTNLRRSHFMRLRTRGVNSQKCLGKLGPDRSLDTASADALPCQSQADVLTNQTGKGSCHHSQVETLLAEPGGYGDFVYGINDSGHSVGSFGNDAVEWASNGTATVLNNLPNVSYSSVAEGINNSGSVVGYCSTSHGDVATYWSKMGAVQNLQAVLGAGWHKPVAEGINDAGDIVGTGHYNGVSSAWELLWVPKAGSADNGSYVNAASPNALHEHAALAWSAVGHSSY